MGEASQYSLPRIIKVGVLPFDVVEEALRAGKVCCSCGGGLASVVLTGVDTSHRVVGLKCWASPRSVPKCVHLLWAALPD
jgi:hypothetical protein